MRTLLWRPALRARVCASCRKLTLRIRRRPDELRPATADPYRTFGEIVDRSFQFMLRRVGWPSHRHAWHDGDEVIEQQRSLLRVAQDPRRLQR